MSFLNLFGLYTARERRKFLADIEKLSRDYMELFQAYNKRAKEASTAKAAVDRYIQEAKDAKLDQDALVRDADALLAYEREAVRGLLATVKEIAAAGENASNGTAKKMLRLAVQAVATHEART